MNSTEELTLCYDQDCPLCVWYSGYFTRHGYLPPSAVQPFAQVQPGRLPWVDAQRMYNEIPLLQPATQQVLYGPQALLHIISRRHPRLARWLGARWLQPLGHLAYRLVSYNRKVVVAKGAVPGTTSCKPSFHAGYRLAFIMLLSLVSAGLLCSAGHWLPAWLMAAAMVIPVGWLAGAWPQQLPAVQARLEWLGQWAMCSLFAAALLLLVAVAAAWHPLATLVPGLPAVLLLSRWCRHRAAYLRGL